MTLLGFKNPVWLGSQISVFSPLDVAGLKVWLDASDSSTITTATGVSNWADKSGEGNDVAQGTGSAQPTVISANQNGLDIIRWDGIDDVLTRTTYTGGAITQQVMTFIVCKMPSAGSGTFGFVFDGQTTRQTFILNTLASPEFQIFAGTALVGSTSTPDTSNFKLHTILFNGGSSTIRVAKVEVESGNAGTGAMNGLDLGASQAPDNYSNVEIAEMLIYDATISNDNRDLIETYLTNKWAVS